MKQHVINRVKKRPRTHIIAAMSYHWLALRVSRLGHAIDAPSPDYGTDCIVTTFHSSTREIEADFFKVQLKATDEVRYKGDTVKFSADMRDLRDWESGALVTFLVVFDAKAERAWWINIQETLSQLDFDPHTSSRAGKMLYLPIANIVDDAAIEGWRLTKNQRTLQVRALL